MRELVDWLNRESNVHPVLASGIAQFQLVHIHPFLDGNGRTSRLLSTLCLYESRVRPETNRRTLQRDLKALVDKGLLVGGGTAPTDPARHYRPAPGLM